MAMLVGLETPTLEGADFADNKINSLIQEA